MERGDRPLWPACGWQQGASPPNREMNRKHIDNGLSTEEGSSAGSPFFRARKREMKKYSPMVENSFVTTNRQNVVKNTTNGRNEAGRPAQTIRRHIIARRSTTREPGYGNDIDYIAVGKRIGKIRREKGIRQAALADRLGISVQYMSAVENGKKCVSLDVLTAIGRELHTSLDELLFGIRPKTVTRTTEQTAHDIRMLFRDTSPAEAEFLISVLKATKKYLDETSGKKTIAGNKH